MKKFMSVLLVTLLALALLGGCKSSPEPSPSGSESPSGSSSPSSSASASPSSSASSSPSSSASSSPSGSPSSSPSTSAGSAKAGMAVLTSLSKSTEATEQADGVAAIDSMVVAVTVNQDGKIMACALDAVQAKVKFDQKGQLLTPADTQLKTNNELGETWFDQAAAFAQYVKGMTVDDVKNIKVDEENVPIEPDLKASVQMSIGNFIKGIEKAVANAKEGGAAESDKLSIGIVSTMDQSKSASSGKAGLAQVDASYAAVTRDAGGKISCCLVDATEVGISFTDKGKITTDLTAQPQSNYELKEAYGLKDASGIGKEWFEQADAFAQYVTGKKPEEVEGIAVDSEGLAVAADLKSSITIPIAGLKAAVIKAVGGV